MNLYLHFQNILKQRLNIQYLKFTIEIIAYICYIIKINKTQNMIVIIQAHPWSGSFNQAILDAITVKLTADKKEYTVINLHKDNFNPVMTEADLALYARGEFADPLVGNYQEILKGADEVVFLFPIWWSGMPAMLKGFFDKVLLVNFSHNYENGWTPLLNIKKTVVVTTSESPTEKFRNAIEGDFIQNSLQAVGFQNPIWLNCEHVGFGTPEHRAEFLKEVAETI